jgi:hypothetical protein
MYMPKKDTIFNKIIYFYIQLLFMYRMSWLFDNSNILLPSVYLHYKLSPNQRVKLVRGRIEEAIRVSRKSQNKEKIRVLPYYWYKYQDKRDDFIEKVPETFQIFNYTCNSEYTIILELQISIIITIM